MGRFTLQPKAACDGEPSVIPAIVTASTYIGSENTQTPPHNELSQRKSCITCTVYPQPGTSKQYRMPLREAFEREGNWLFRNRSWLPLLLYPFAVVIIYFQRDKAHLYITDASWGIICFLISLAGLAVRALTIGFTPQGTSGRNTEKQVAEALNETGIYSVVRHPLYLGNFLMWLGLFLFIGVWWFVLICSLVYWLYYERIMYAEEEFLRREYSARYEAWASRTPAFLPRLSNWIPPRLSFAFKNVLKREYNGLFATVLSFALLNGISHYFVERRFEVDNLWKIVFGIGALIFIVLRTLKKNTRLLDVAGR